MRQPLRLSEILLLSCSGCKLIQSTRSVPGSTTTTCNFISRTACLASGATCHSGSRTHEHSHIHQAQNNEVQRSTPFTYVFQEVTMLCTHGVVSKNPDCRLSPRSRPLLYYRAVRDLTSEVDSRTRLTVPFNSMREIQHKRHGHYLIRSHAHWCTLSRYFLAANWNTPQP